MDDAWGQVGQNEPEKAHKLDPVHDLFHVRWPDVSDKVVFEESSDAREKTSHMGIL